MLEPGHQEQILIPSNGQTEVTNRNLLKIIKAWLVGVKGVWPKELPRVLWAYRTIA